MSKLEEALKKAFKESLRVGTDKFWATDFLRSGIEGLDFALGGGWGTGRFHELFGPWSTGKTMIGYMTLVNAQRLGYFTVLGESEGAYDENFFRKLGGDPTKLQVQKVDVVEDAFDAIATISKAKEKLGDTIPVFYLWDSIAQAGTRHLAEVGMDKVDMAKAKQMAQGCSYVTGLIKNQKITVLATNHIIDSIGDNDSATQTPGGKKWKFSCSQRVELAMDGGTSTSSILDVRGDKSTQIGRWIRGQVVKNKCAPPWSKFIFPIYVKDGCWHPEGYPYGTTLGVDRVESLFYFYLRKHILIPSTGEPVVSMPSNGWYQIHESIAPEESKFQKKDWPEKLGKYPQLWTIPYDWIKAGRENTSESESSEAESGAS